MDPQDLQPPHSYNFTKKGAFIPWTTSLHLRLSPLLASLNFYRTDRYIAYGRCYLSSEDEREAEEEERFSWALSPSDAEEVPPLPRRTGALTYSKRKTGAGSSSSFRSKTITTSAGKTWEQFKSFVKCGCRQAHRSSYRVFSGRSLPCLPCHGASTSLPIKNVSHTYTLHDERRIEPVFSVYW